MTNWSWKTPASVWLSKAFFFLAKCGDPSSLLLGTATGDVTAYRTFFFFLKHCYFLRIFTHFLFN